MEKPEVTEIENPVDELVLLKERADLMGIKYQANIGIDKLKERVNDALEPKEKPPEPKPKKVFKPETIPERNTRLRKEANRLVRIRLTCMDPNKKSWPGEIITAGNAIIGTVKKYVPFHAEEGYHLPYIIFQQLKTRKHQEFVKTRVNGRNVMKPQLVKSFAIEVLDPLTKTELKELGDRQALNHSIDR